MSGEAATDSPGSPEASSRSHGEVDEDIQALEKEEDAAPRPRADQVEELNVQWALMHSCTSAPQQISMEKLPRTPAPKMADEEEAELQWAFQSSLKMRSGMLPESDRSGGAGPSSATVYNSVALHTPRSYDKEEEKEEEDALAPPVDKLEVLNEEEEEEEEDVNAIIVGTWNLENFTIYSTNGVDYRLCKLPNLVRTILDSKVHILALQEISREEDIVTLVGLLTADALNKGEPSTWCYEISDNLTRDGSTRREHAAFLWRKPRSGSKLGENVVKPWSEHGRAQVGTGSSFFSLPESYFRRSPFYGLFGLRKKSGTGSQTWHPVLFINCHLKSDPTGSKESKPDAYDEVKELHHLVAAAAWRNPHVWHLLQVVVLGDVNCNRRTLVDNTVKAGRVNQAWSSFLGDADDGWVRYPKDGSSMFNEKNCYDGIFIIHSQLSSILSCKIGRFMDVPSPPEGDKLRELQHMANDEVDEERKEQEEEEYEEDVVRLVRRKYYSDHKMALVKLQVTASSVSFLDKSLEPPMLPDRRDMDQMCEVYQALNGEREDLSACMLPVTITSYQIIEKSKKIKDKIICWIKGNDQQPAFLDQPGHQKEWISGALTTLTNILSELFYLSSELSKESNSKFNKTNREDLHRHLDDVTKTSYAPILKTLFCSYVTERCRSYLALTISNLLKMRQTASNYDGAFPALDALEALPSDFHPYLHPYPLFVSLLSSSRHRTQENAVRALRMLAETDYGKAIVSGAIHSLVFLLSHSNLQVQENAAGALLRFSENEQYQQMFSGAIPSLVFLLLSSSQDVQKNAAGALKNLVKIDVYQMEMVRYKVIPHLASLLKSSINLAPINPAIAYACGVLRTLADKDAYHEELVSFGVISSLVSILKNDCYLSPPTREDICHSLTSLAKGDPCVVVRDGLHAVFEALILILTNDLYSSREAKKAALSTLMILSDPDFVHPQDLKSFLKKTQKMACLRDCLTDSDLQESAAYIFMKLCSVDGMLAHMCQLKNMVVQEKSLDKKLNLIVNNWAASAHAKEYAAEALRLIALARENGFQLVGAALWSTHLRRPAPRALLEA